jgi:hypothetical protein
MKTLNEKQKNIANNINVSSVEYSLNIMGLDYLCMNKEWNLQQDICTASTFSPMKRDEHRGTS